MDGEYKASTNINSYTFKGASGPLLEQLRWRHIQGLLNILKSIDKTCEAGRRSDKRPFIFLSKFQRRTHFKLMLLDITATGQIPINGVVFAAVLGQLLNCKCAAFIRSINLNGNSETGNATAIKTPSDPYGKYSRHKYFSRILQGVKKSQRPMLL